MPFGMDASVRGAEDLARLAAACKLTGDGQLRKDMLKGIRLAAKPVATAIKDEFASDLPKSGGVNDWYAGMKLAPRTRTTGKSAGVRISGPKRGRGADAGRVNSDGRVRHPKYGDRRYWYNTDVEAGIADRGGEKAMPKAMADLQVVMNETLARIARST